MSQDSPAARPTESRCRLASQSVTTALCLTRRALEGVTDFAALERDLLAALKHDGARWLEELLNDPALPYKNNRPEPDEADYGQRPKAVLLTLGWITLR